MTRTSRAVSFMCIGSSIRDSAIVSAAMLIVITAGRCISAIIVDASASRGASLTLRPGRALPRRIAHRHAISAFAPRSRGARGLAHSPLAGSTNFEILGPKGEQRSYNSCPIRGAFAYLTAHRGKSEPARYGRNYV